MSKGAGSGIAVIIPAKEAASTIGAALASIAAQSLAPEIVVVFDDGSADDTAEVAASWRGRLPIEVLSSTASVGPAAARHRAIENVRAPIIALLDADDVWLPDHLQSLRSVMVDDETIATADAVRWLPGVGPGRVSLRQRTPVPPTRQLEALLLENYVFVGSMFSRATYLRAGGFRTGGVEDWDLWLRMVRAGATVRPAPGPTVLYRVSPTSRSAGDRELGAQVELLRGLVADEVDPAIRRAAQRSLRRLRARQALVSSYALAADGSLIRARARAVGALSGPRSVVLRGVLMTLAPRAGERQRRASQERLLGGPV